MAVRCIAKVADAYKLDKKVKRKFSKHSAQPYDDRIFRFKDDNMISIWTITGRVTVPYQCGERQRQLLQYRKGEVDLMLIRGVFYIAVVCDIPDPDTIDIKNVLGIDLGIVNLATDSNGTAYSGNEVEVKRRIFAHRRRNLQRKGTKASKRKLCQISGKQARYQKDINHQISKAIVQTAQRSESAIALEELAGIRGRVKARRRQRARLSNWGFHQLRQYISYKAKMVGIPIILVDPRHTSQECRRCLHISRRNRPSQDRFLCERCGFSAHADTNAARNIRARALVNVPMVAACQLTLAFVE
jgi:IS605 OrfB family transposase